ncbi:MAG: IS1182 family transposase [Acidobacteria bacterium]|nr:MAG: IS1182 family transposase [Acidobacteriota bacterium]
MTYEIKADRSQTFLLPPSLEDWIPSDHPVRFIDAFVRSLDLQKMGFEQGHAPTGRPSFSAELLLSVICFCYFSRIRTLRGMEQACHDNMAVLWLTGNQHPDHNTIWLFFRNNREAIRKLLKQSVRVAAASDLVGMVLYAVDGTKIQAQGSTRTASYRKKLSKALERVDASIEEMENNLSTSWETGLGTYVLPEGMSDKKALKEVILQKLEELDQAETDSLQPSDPDAKIMKCDGRKVFAYNAQAVTDAKNGIVIAGDVITNQNDQGMLAPMINMVKENTGGVAETTLGDKGYSAGEDLAEAQAKGYNVLVNLKKDVNPEDNEKLFCASRFEYDPEEDCCICPLGKKLKFQRIAKDKKRKTTRRVYHCSGYKECPQRWNCSKNKRGRTVGLSEHHLALADQRQKQKDPDARAMLRRRPVIVEPTFAFTKEALLFRRWTQRTVEGAKTQWALMCTTVNLRKLYLAWLNGEVDLA